MEIWEILVSVGGGAATIKFLLPIVERMLRGGHKQIKEVEGYQTGAAFLGNTIPGNKTEDEIADFALAYGAKLKKHGNVENPKEDALNTVKGILDEGSEE